MLVLLEILIDQHGEGVPQDRDALETLLGVGRKTANVALDEASGEPAIGVNTNIFRVGNKTGPSPVKTPDAAYKELLRPAPERYRKEGITG